MKIPPGGIPANTFTDEAAKDIEAKGGPQGGAVDTETARVAAESIAKTVDRNNDGMITKGEASRLSSLQNLGESLNPVGDSYDKLSKSPEGKKMIYAMLKAWRANDPDFQLQSAPEDMIRAIDLPAAGALEVAMARLQDTADGARDSVAKANIGEVAVRATAFGFLSVVSGVSRLFGGDGIDLVQ